MNVRTVARLVANRECSTASPNKRPIAVTSIAWLLIAAGVFGFAVHVRELVSQKLSHFEELWIRAGYRRDRVFGRDRNRNMRRILNQAANAAVKHKGSIFEIVYRRLVPRLGHKKTIGAIVHRMCQLIWILLHTGVRYEERGPQCARGPGEAALCE